MGGIPNYDVTTDNTMLVEKSTAFLNTILIEAQKNMAIEEKSMGDK